MTLRRAKPYWAGKGAGSEVNRPFYDDADIIFSHIKMRSTYSGFWARVERDSDNATMDIGFLANRLPDLASADSFRGSDVLSIKWIYNQGTMSGNDPDNAAKNGGRVNPNFNAIIHDGTDWVRIGDWLALDNDIPGQQDSRIARYEFGYDSPSILDANSMAFSVFQNSTGTSFYWSFGESKLTNTDTFISKGHDNRSASGFAVQYRPTGSITNISNNENPSGNHEQSTYTRSTNSIAYRRNGTAINSNTSANVFSAETEFILGIFGIRWSAANSDDYNNKTRSKFQELIVYASYDETKRDDIEAEQTSFYGTI